MNPHRPSAIAIGLGAEPALRSLLSTHPSFELVELESEADVINVVGACEVAAIVLGPALTPRRSAQLLTGLAETLPGMNTANIVLAYGKEKALFQSLVDQDRVFYLSEAPGRSVDVAQIVASAVRHRVATNHEVANGSQAISAARRLRILDLARHLSAIRDVGGAASHLVRSTAMLLSSDRAHVLLYDAEADTLVAPGYDDNPERCESAAAGLVAFAARTGTPVRVSRASDDPRYDRDADDPSGRGDERLAAVALLSTSSRRIGVLVAVRTAEDPPFTDEDMDLLAAVAGETAAPLDRVVAESRILAQERSQPFRVEALAHQFEAHERPGEVLRLSPRWTYFTFELLFFALVTSLIVSLVFNVNEYATGPAVVRFEDKSDLTTAREGVVASLSSRPGDAVVKGQSLVHLVDAAEAAEAERLGREFELQLVAVLRDPMNQSARAQLATTRAQRDAAGARLAERTLRAPRDGIVSGVRVRAGQKVNAGDVVLSLVGDRDVHVVGLLPGRYRAELKPGTMLRFELSGYEHVYQTNPVESVGEVVSAEEASRYLGLETTLAGGPVVIVTARMRQATYEAGRQTYRYHDGMPGTSEVRVRSEPALVALVPALRYLLSPSD